MVMVVVRGGFVGGCGEAASGGVGELGVWGVALAPRVVVARNFERVGAMRPHPSVIPFYRAKC